MGISCSVLMGSVLSRGRRVWRLSSCGCGGGNKFWIGRFFVILVALTVVGCSAGCGDCVVDMYKASS